MSNWCGRHMIRHSATLRIIVTIFPTTPIVPALWHREQSSSLTAHPHLFIYKPLKLWKYCSLSHSVRTFRNLLGLRGGGRGGRGGGGGPGRARGGGAGGAAPV